MKTTAMFSVATAAVIVALSGSASATTSSRRYSPKFEVIPHESDPKWVSAQWKNGAGCALSDPLVGCFDTDPLVDHDDTNNEGLILAKSANTEINKAVAWAQLTGVKGAFLNEIGYDIRKPFGDYVGPSGSQCSVRSPRFEIKMRNGDQYYLVPCATAMTAEAQKAGWTRLTWTGPIDACTDVLCDINLPRVPIGCDPTAVPNTCDASKRIDDIRIVFDEGPDSAAPPANQFFGLAVLDNIRVNAYVEGDGPQRKPYADEDEGQGRDGDGTSHKFHSSKGHPESSELEYSDPVNNVNVKTVGGATSLAYNGTCLTYVGNALVNNNPGYVATFVACDTSSTGLANLGTYVMDIAGGPLGSLPYHKEGALSEGYVKMGAH